MKRLRAVTLILAVLAAGAIVTAVYRNREPRYQDRKLSQWLDARSRPNGYFDITLVDSDPYWKEPRRAVLQAIGTNAIPFLLKWGSAKDSPTKAKIISWINPHLPSRYRIWRARELQSAAWVGFALLGDKAKPAWPVLVQWTYDKEADHRSLGFVFLQNAKADKATMLPVYQRLLNDPDKQLREMVAFQFCYFYRKEAIAADVYERFPQLQLQNMHAHAPDTNQPAPHN